jgi:hypothetical protein
MVQYQSKQIRRAKRETNLNRFRKHFGSSPLVCALIWEDFQMTEVQDAWVPPDSRRFEYFLMAMHYLKLYPKEYERKASQHWSHFYRQHSALKPKE